MGQKDEARGGAAATGEHRERPVGERYDPEHPILSHFSARSMTFALPSFSPGQARLIRTIELVTGKPRLLWLARKFLTSSDQGSGSLWERLISFLEIEITTPPDQLARIPATGPAVVVANHPFGFVDGLVMARIVTDIRPDLKVLTRSFGGTPLEIRDAMVPVAMPEDPDFARRNIAVRKEVMGHLRDGGIVALFPAGRVATSQSFFGPAEEHPWSAFTAKMILQSDAVVVPVFFPGQNSRMFQIAQRLSPVLRQSLLMHEITRRIGKPIAPVIGDPMGRDEIALWRDRPGQFMAELRARTLALANRGAQMG